MAEDTEKKEKERDVAGKIVEAVARHIVLNAILPGVGSLIGGLLDAADAAEVAGVVTDVADSSS